MTPDLEHFELNDKGRQNIAGERGFHQKRFARMAKKHEERGLVGKILSPRVKTAQDFMLAEAYREKLEREKRESAEYRAWEKNLRPVLEDIWAIKEHKPGSEKFVSLLLVGGGGMMGARGSGQLLGMQEMGLNKVFSAVIGVSAGSATAGEFIAGHAENPARIFIEDCTKKEFIDLRRAPEIFRPGTRRPILDVSFLEKVLREGPKAMHQDLIRQSPTDFYVVVYDPKTRQSRLLDAKTAKPDMVAACAASSAAPIVYGKTVEVNGQRYVDGGYDPMPLEAILKQFPKVNRVLILPNVPFQGMSALQYSPGEYLLMNLVGGMAGSMGSMGSIGEFETYMRGKEKFRKDLEFIQKQTGVKIGVLWPHETELYQFSTDPDQVKAAVLESARGTIADFGQKQPRKIRLYQH